MNESVPMRSQAMYSVETHRVEFKRELTPELDLEKEVVAFLNSHEGGFIYIGIDKNGQRVGSATEFYGPECFRFTENFLRITFAASGPVYEEEATEQVEAPVEAPVALTDTDQKILTALAAQPLGRSPLLRALGYSQPTGNYKAAMAKLLQARLIEPTIPDKPNSRLQQYRLTAQGKALLK